VTPVPKFAAVVRIGLLALLCQSVGACGLDRSLRHDLCATDADCSSGHVCVNGMCCDPMADAGCGYGASDVREAGGADGGYDASDVRDPGDAGGEVRDPCTPTADDGARIKVSDIPGALLGVWRLCDATPGPEVSWLVGGPGTIQIDMTTWQRGETGAGSGLYFLILEGTKDLVHFIDPDLESGVGADFSATILPDSHVLELSPCDGPETCSADVSRFVPVDPATRPGG